MQDDRGIEVLDLEGPEIAEVVLLMPEHLHDEREGEGQHDLHRHHRDRADALIGAVAVAAEEEGAAHHHGQRVQDAVERPLA